MLKRLLPIKSESNTKYVQMSLKMTALGLGTLLLTACGSDDREYLPLIDAPNEIQDTDSDGIADTLDNCVRVANPNQNNLDNDMFGDVCDEDIDGDGMVNERDALPRNPNETLDTDGDQIGNNADLDDDGDGMTDLAEIEAGTNPLDPLSFPNNTGGNNNGNGGDNPIDPPANQNLTNFVASNPAYTRFSHLLTQVPSIENEGTTLGAELDALTDITVFLPTDDALMRSITLMEEQSLLSDTNLDGVVDELDLIADTDFAQTFVAYHVLPQAYTANMFMNDVNHTLVNLAQLPLTVNADNELLTQIVQYNNLVNENLVTYAQINLTPTRLNTATVFNIDKALVPPTRSIDEMIKQLPQLSELQKIHGAFDDSIRALTNNDSDLLTLLAPYNTAVSNKCEEYAALQLYRNGVCNRGAMGIVFREEFPNEVNTASLVRQGIQFSAELGTFSGNLITPNIIATDGVIHIVDQLQAGN